MEHQLDRIADAFERIACALESINKGIEISLSGDIDASIDGSSIILEGPLLVQHEFASDALQVKGKLFLEPDEREGFSVKLTK